jgi:hypothetical protein
MFSLAVPALVLGISIFLLIVHARDYGLDRWMFLPVILGFASLIAIVEYAWVNRVSVDNEWLRQYRWCGLGNRRIPLALVARVRLREETSALMLRVTGVRIEWPDGLIQLTTDMYHRDQLRDLMVRLRDHGALVAESVLREVVVE